MPRLAALLLGLLLAASAVYWVLQWPKQDTGRPMPVAAAPDARPQADPAAMARLLGGTAAPLAEVATAGASQRLRLTGIIASPAGQGVALLALDGNPPKPYRVGSKLEEGLVLQSVEARRVSLARSMQAPAHLRLELAPQDR